MKKIIFATMCVCLMAMMGSVYAHHNDATTTTATKEIGIKDVIKRVEAAGYKTIHKVEREHDAWEIDAKNAKGERFDIEMDMTGKIISVTQE